MNSKIEYKRIPQIRNSKTQNKNEKATGICEKGTDQTWERV